MNMYKLFFILSLSMYASTVFSQKIKNVCGEYTFYVPENVSLNEAKQTALEQAKLQAVASEFGTIVSQISTGMDKEENGKTDSRFFSLSSMEVKGEWLENKGEPKYTYATDKENGNMIVTCSICGKAREVTTAKTEFIAKILRNGVEAKYESDVFRSGDDMYLLFQSPTNGYIAVYLIDETPTAYCLLPYRKDENGQQPVKHGETYIFFSPKHTINNANVVDEYTLTCSEENEMNQIYIVFSPNPFIKALDYQAKEILPRELNYKSFTQWLSNCRKRDTKMEVTVKRIRIENNK